MKTVRISKKRSAALFGIMAISAAAFAGPASARISGSQDFALPDGAKNKGYVLTVGERTISTPRLQDAGLNVTWTADQALPLPQIALANEVLGCPEGTKGVLSLSPMNVAGGADAFVSATIRAATSTGGAFTESTGPVGASPNGSGGSTIPGITLCEY